MAAYDVLRIPLTALVDRREIIPPGRRITSVTILVLPLDADLALASSDGPMFPIVAQGLQLKPCDREVASQGLYARVGAATGGEAVLLVTYAGGLIEITGGGATPGATFEQLANGSRFWQTGSPGDTPTVALVNPVGSGPSLYLKSVRGWTGAVAINLFVVPWLVTAGAGGTVTPGGKRWQDRRVAGSPVGIVRGVTFADDQSRAVINDDIVDGVVGGASPIGRPIQLADAIDRWVVPPGHSVMMRTGTAGAGVQLIGVFVWREG